MFTLPVYNSEGKEVDMIKLNADVFDGSQNLDCLHQAILGYQANQRKGLASTKTRGEVSGGGKKPWKQKGTGRARVGRLTRRTGRAQTIAATDRATRGEQRRRPDYR